MWPLSPLEIPHTDIGVDRVPSARFSELGPPAPGGPFSGDLGSIGLVLCWLIPVQSPHLGKLWDFLCTPASAALIVCKLQGLSQPWEGPPNVPGPSISREVAVKTILCGGHRCPGVQDKQIVLKQSSCGPRSQIPAE